MNKNKHLSIEERSTIKSMLDSTASFKPIARSLGRDCTTISKEVRGHLLFQKTGCFGQSFNDCTNRRNCPVSGISISEAEALTLDEFISPLLRKGQSIHHICANNSFQVMFSEKTLYNYVNSGIFSARNTAASVFRIF